MIVENAIRGGIRVVGVHPTAASVSDVECFASIDKVPFRPEVAFMLVGHRRIEAAFKEVLAAGVRAFVLPGLGNEAGAEGPEVARRVAELAREGGAEVVGPNCMGVAVPDAPSLWIGTLTPTFLPGHVSAVVHSGSIGEALVAVGPRIGFRCVVSSGTELVTDVGDYCAFFAQDEGTRAVGLFLESVRRPAAFARALELLARAGKPVACLKVGRTPGGARAVLTHSGAVVGSDVAFSAMLRGYGVIEVDDFPDLVEVLEVLGRKRRPRGTRLGGVTNSGGEGALLADHAESAGIPFRPLSEGLAQALSKAFPNYVAPGNPVDAWAIDTVERVFPGTLELLGRSGEFDILVAQIDQSQYLGASETENAVLTTRALADAVEGTGVFPAVTSVQSCDAPAEVAALARERDVALLRGSRSAMRALAAVADWAPRFPTEQRHQAQVDLADLLRPGPLPEHESCFVLERYGIRVAARRRAPTPDAAADAAEALGFPVVVKRDGPAHKSRDGGVVLGLADGTSVRAVAARLGGPVLVAAMQPPGFEAYCGMLRDPQFGPVLVVGLGGEGVENMPGSAACIAPIGFDEARRLVRDAHALSKAVSGSAADALARVIVALGRIAIEHPDVAAVDVNPLLVGDHDVVAVDALVVVERQP